MFLYYSWNFSVMKLFPNKKLKKNYYKVLSKNSKFQSYNFRVSKLLPFYHLPIKKFLDDTDKLIFLKLPHLGLLKKKKNRGNIHSEAIIKSHFPPLENKR